MEYSEWRLRVSDDFSSSHQLRNYGGKCESLHGHNFLVEMEVKGNEVDPDTGMLMDFKVLKQKLGAVLDMLDHKHLNDLEWFKKVNPSSENLAKFVYENLKPALQGEKVTIEWVMVAEKNSSKAFYREV
ncbi:MAG: 6-carboxytetrahydropterin synthase QueD [Desulfonatronovibrio sp.]